MKIDDLRKSKNVEDRRGQSGGYSSPGGGLGGGGLGGGGGLLLQLLFSRGGWKTKLLLLFLLLLLGSGSGLGSIFGGPATSVPYQSTQVNNENSEASDRDVEFFSKVLGSTEDFWTNRFAEDGMSYNKPAMVVYTGQTSTACGVGQAASGPFYCSADKTVYIETSFYQELSTRYQAAGDFAMAYVIAHEVGHHVQNELGVLGDYHQKRQRLSDKEGNVLNVRLELQADYYAGAWANYVKGEGILEAGDIQEAMNAAHAVGDDTLQKKTYGRVVPDSFTHGTSEQRKRWFDRGFQYGDIDHGDTFSIPEQDL